MHWLWCLLLNMYLLSISSSRLYLCYILAFNTVHRISWFKTLLVCKWFYGILCYFNFTQLYSDLIHCRCPKAVNYILFGDMIYHNPIYRWHQKVARQQLECIPFNNTRFHFSKYDNTLPIGMHVVTWTNLITYKVQIGWVAKSVRLY